MRTTLNIDDDVLAVARALAERSGISLGQALSELARRGLKNGLSSKNDVRKAIFPVGNDADPITSEDVYNSLNQWP